MEKDQKRHWESPSPQVQKEEIQLCDVNIKLNTRVKRISSERLPISVDQSIACRKGKLCCGCKWQEDLEERGLNGNHIPALKLSCLHITLASEMVSPSKETGRKVPKWHTSRTPSFGVAPPSNCRTSPWTHGTVESRYYATT